MIIGIAVWLLCKINSCFVIDLFNFIIEKTIRIVF